MLEALPGHPDLLALAARLLDRAEAGEISSPVAAGVALHVRGLARLVADGDRDLASALDEAQALAAVATVTRPANARAWRAAA